MCRFKYFSHYNPIGSVIDAGSEILLANVQAPFILNCHQKSTPIRSSGFSYTIVSRNDLCECSLTTAHHYLAPKVTNCNNTKNTLALKYVLNAAVYTIFNTSKLKVDLKQLYNAIPNYKVPKLSIDLDKHHDVLLEEHSTPIDLSKLALLANSNNSIYFSKHDKLEDLSNIDSWFKWHNFELGFGFIGSIFGSIAFVCVIIMFVKSHRYTVLMSSLFSSLPQVEAQASYGQVDDEFKLWKFQNVLIGILIILAIYGLYSVVKVIRSKYALCKLLNPTAAAPIVKPWA